MDVIRMMTEQINVISDVIHLAQNKKIGMKEMMLPMKMIKYGKTAGHG